MHLDCEPLFPRGLTVFPDLLPAARLSPEKTWRVSYKKIGRDRGRFGFPCKHKTDKAGLRRNVLKPADTNTIPGPECRDCLLKLRDQALTACRPGPDLAASLAARSAEMIEKGLERHKVPAEIATGFLHLMTTETGQADPFQAKKAADFTAAGQAAAALGPVPDTLAARARAAILGNALDHFSGPETGRRWRDGAELSLGLDHLDRVEPLLRPGARVVILADNAGEQSFDRLLVAHLHGRGCRVSYVVKSGPVQNDLTLADLAAQGQCSGLGRVMGSGTAQVGLAPRQVPQPLAAVLSRADLVIAKGMGHYETLRRAGLRLGEDSTPLPLLFLLLAKCRPVARGLNVALGAGVALLAGHDFASH